MIRKYAKKYGNISINDFESKVELYMKLGKNKKMIVE